MKRFFQWVKEKNNREIAALIGSGITFFFAGLWTVFTYFHEDDGTDKNAETSAHKILDEPKFTPSPNLINSVYKNTLSKKYGPTKATCRYQIELIDNNFYQLVGQLRVIHHGLTGSSSAACDIITVDANGAIFIRETLDVSVPAHMPQGINDNEETISINFKKDWFEQNIAADYLMISIRTTDFMAEFFIDKFDGALPLTIGETKELGASSIRRGTLTEE